MISILFILFCLSRKVLLSGKNLRSIVLERCVWIRKDSYTPRIFSVRAANHRKSHTVFFFILFNNIMLQFFIQMRNRVNARDLFLVTVLEFTILTKYNTVTQNGFTAGAIFSWNYNFLKNCHFSLSLNKFFF